MRRNGEIRSATMKLPSKSRFWLRLRANATRNVMMSSQSVLWIDGVGGYAMCDRETTIIGGASAAADVPLRLMSDLPSKTAIFHHQGQDHLIEPIHSVWLNGQEIRTTSLLSSGDRIRLGSSVELAFSQPTQLSGTAVLMLRSGHRWRGAIDGALLLGHSCLIGPSPTAHVCCRHWEKDIVLFRHRDQWMVRRDEYTEDGSIRTASTHPLKLGERIQGQGYSMTWL